MEIRYQTFKDNKLLVLKWIGEWSLENLREYSKELSKDPDMKLISKIMSDLRDAKLDGALKDIDFLVRRQEENTVNKYINVHIVTDPSSTVVSHLYQQKLKAKGFSYEYCSTVAHALELLNLNMDANEMEELLRNMKSSGEV